MKRVLNGIVVNVLGCEIVTSEFELQLLLSLSDNLRKQDFQFIYR